MSREILKKTLSLIEELERSLPEKLANEIKNLSKIITHLSRKKDNSEELEPIREEILSEYRKSLRLDLNAPQGEILKAAQDKLKEIVHDTKNAKAIDQIITRLNLIIADFNQVEEDCLNPEDAVIDVNQYNVKRQDGETVASYIMRIQAQVKVIKDKQRLLDALFLKVKLFENLSLSIPTNPPANKKRPKLTQPTEEAKNKVGALSQVLEKNYKTHNVKNEELQGQAKEELNNLNPNKPAENKIIVYVWYLKGVVPGSRKMFGLDSTGHIGISVGKDIYLSFYPNKSGSAKPSFLAKIAKKIGMPSPDSCEGVFRPLEEDLFRRYISTDNYSYWQCEAIELTCDDKLDMEKATNFAQDLLDNPAKYTFYRKNCSTIGVEVLQAAGAEKILPFPIAFGKLPDSPGEVRNYAKDLDKCIKEANPREKLVAHSPYQQRIRKRLAHIRAELQKDLNALIKNHEPYNNDPDYKTKENREGAQKLLEAAIKKIEDIDFNIERASDVVAINTILVANKYDTAIKSVSNYINEEMPFLTNFVAKHIAPQFSTLKIFLPSENEQNIKSIFGILKASCTAPMGEVQTAIPKMNYSLLQLVERQSNAIVSLEAAVSYKGTDQDLLDLKKLIDENPRQFSLEAVKTLDQIAKNFNHELNEKIQACDYIYVRALKQLADRLRKPELVDQFYTKNKRGEVKYATLERALNELEIDGNDVDTKSLVNKVVGNYIDKDCYTSLETFEKAYVEQVQIATGIFNGYLYFDSHVSYEEQDNNNIMARLRLVLGVEGYVIKDVTGLLNASINQFKNNENTTYGNASQAIFQILTSLERGQNNSIPYIKGKRQIEEKIAQAANWTLSATKKQLNILKFQAFVVAAHQGFVNGQLNKEEFVCELREAAKIIDGAKKQTLDRYIDSFASQAYLDDVSPEEKQKFVDVKNFNFYDDLTKEFISSDDPLEFIHQLPIEVTDQERMKQSSLYILENVVSSICTQPLFTTEMNLYGVKRWDYYFSNALQEGIGENKKDQANKKLLQIYNEIKAKTILTNSEKLFIDLYDHLQVATMFLNTRMSARTREEKIDKLLTESKTYQGDYFYSKLKELTCYVRTAGRLTNLAQESVMHQVNSLSVSFQLELYKRVDQYSKLEQPQDNKQILDKTVIFTHLTELGKHKESGFDETELSAIRAGIGGREANDSLILDKLVANNLNNSRSAEAKLISKSCSKYLSKLCKDRKDIQAIVEIYKVRAFLTQADKSLFDSTTWYENIVSLRQNLKIQYELIKKTNLPEENGEEEDNQVAIIAKVDYDSLKNDTLIKLNQSIGTLNKLVFLEDNKIKKLIAKFLDVEGSEGKTIEKILQEATFSAVDEARKFNYSPEDHYKMQLIEMIGAFSAGNMDEVKFYHKLSSYIEDHKRPNSYGPFNFIYDFFARHDRGHKYNQMSNLEAMRKAFLNKYAGLEAKRLEGSFVSLNGDMKRQPEDYVEQGSSIIGSNLKRERKAVDFLTEIEIDERNKQKSTKKLKSTITSKLYSFFQKSQKEDQMDAAKKVKLNVKYEHYNTRKEELYGSRKEQDDTEKKTESLFN